MHIRIHDVGRCIHLLSFFEFQRALAAHEIETSWEYHWDDWSARSFFRQHFRDSYEIRALRSALVHDIYNLSRMSDDDIVAAAAQRLCSGAWCIGYDRLPPAVSAGAAPAQVTVARIGTPQRQPSAPRPLRQREPTQSQAHARDPVAAASAEPEWSEETEQAAFAGVLEQAAQVGTPFCEICAAMRKLPSQRTG